MSTDWLLITPLRLLKSYTASGHPIWSKSFLGYLGVDGVIVIVPNDDDNNVDDDDDDDDEDEEIRIDLSSPSTLSLTPSTTTNITTTAFQINFISNRSLSFRTDDQKSRDAWVDKCKGFCGRFKGVGSVASSIDVEDSEGEVYVGEAWGNDDDDVGEEDEGILDSSGRPFFPPTLPSQEEQNSPVPTYVPPARYPHAHAQNNLPPTPPRHQTQTQTKFQSKALPNPVKTTTPPRTTRTNPPSKPTARSSSDNLNSSTLSLLGGDYSSYVHPHNHNRTHTQTQPSLHTSTSQSIPQSSGDDEEEEQEEVGNQEATDLTPIPHPDPLTSSTFTDMTYLASSLQKSETLRKNLNSSLTQIDVLNEEKQALQENVKSGQRTCREYEANRLSLATIVKEEIDSKTRKITLQTNQLNEYISITNNQTHDISVLHKQVHTLKLQMHDQKHEYNNMIVNKELEKSVSLQTGLSDLETLLEDERKLHKGSLSGLRKEYERRLIDGVENGVMVGVKKQSEAFERLRITDSKDIEELWKGKYNKVEAKLRTEIKKLKVNFAGEKKNIRSDVQKLTTLHHEHVTALNLTLKQSNERLIDTKAALQSRDLQISENAITLSNSKHYNIKTMSEFQTKYNLITHKNETLANSLTEAKNVIKELKSEALKADTKHRLNNASLTGASMRSYEVENEVSSLNEQVHRLTVSSNSSSLSMQNLKRENSMLLSQNVRIKGECDKVRMALVDVNAGVYGVAKAKSMAKSVLNDTGSGKENNARSSLDGRKEEKRFSDVKKAYKPSLNATGSANASMSTIMSMGSSARHRRTVGSSMSMSMSRR